MTIPETLTAGQVWRTTGADATDLTIVMLAASTVETVDGWQNRQRWPLAEFHAVAPWFRGWDGPPGTVLPTLPGFIGGCAGDWRPPLASLEMPLDPGWEAFRNGDLALQGMRDVDTGVFEVEQIALALDSPDPKADDWRIRTVGALSGAVYQRQGTGRWVLVRRLEGYA
jgi:hypothetical protein